MSLYSTVLFDIQDVSFEVYQHLSMNSKMNFDNLLAKDVVTNKIELEENMLSSHIFVYRTHLFHFKGIIFHSQDNDDPKNNRQQKYI